jgi:hypothetical protein
VISVKTEIDKKKKRFVPRPRLILLRRISVPLGIKNKGAAVIQKISLHFCKQVIIGKSSTNNQHSA